MKCQKDVKKSEKNKLALRSHQTDSPASTDGLRLSNNGPQVRFQGHKGQGQGQNPLVCGSLSQVESCWLCRSPSFKVNMSTEVTGRVNLPKFDDDKMSYAEWKPHFMAYIVSQLGQFILDGLEVPTDVTPSSTKDEKERFKKNAMLYTMLVQCTSGTPRELVNDSKTTTLTHGCFKTAWERLEKEYAPKGATDQMMKLDEFNRCKLKNPQDDPRSWFTDLRRLQRELQDLSVTKTDEELMAHVMSSLAVNLYGDLLTNLRTSMGLQQSAVKWETFTKLVKQHYDLTVVSDKMERDLSLNTVDRPRPICGHCHRPGHTTENCWNLPENRSKREEYMKNIQCHICGQTGHLARNCPSQSQSNNNSNSTGGGMFVGALTDFQRPQKTSDRWLLDTGSAVHVCNDPNQFDYAEPTKEQLITPDRQKIKTEFMGSVTLDVINPSDDLDEYVQLQEVYCAPKSRYNIFSVPKFLEDPDWMLLSNQDTIWLENSITNVKLTFCPCPREDGYLLYFLDTRDEDDITLIPPETHPDEYGKTQITEHHTRQQTEDIIEKSRDYSHRYWKNEGQPSTAGYMNHTDGYQTEPHSDSSTHDPLSVLLRNDTKPLTQYNNKTLQEDLWLLDPSADSHVTHNPNDLVTMERVQACLSYVGGSTMWSMYRGSVNIASINQGNVMVHHVHLQTDFRYKILSLVQLRKEGWIVEVIYDEEENDRIIRLTRPMGTYTPQRLFFRPRESEHGNKLYFLNYTGPMQSRPVVAQTPIETPNQSQIQARLNSDLRDKSRTTWHSQTGNITEYLAHQGGLQLDEFEVGNTPREAAYALNPDPPYGYHLKWIADTGATCHICKHLELLTDVQPAERTLLVGNGKTVTSHWKGTYHGTAMDGVDYVLAEVYYVPNFSHNIISINQFLKNGCTLQGQMTTLSLVNRSQHHLTFHKLHTDNGWSKLFYLTDRQTVDTDEMIFSLGDEEVGPVNKDEQQKKKKTKKTMRSEDINVMHKKLGHVCEAYLRNTCKERNVKLKGKLKSCNACALAKAKAKKVCKTASVKAKRPGERLFVDISGPYKKSVKGNKFWVMAVDDKTRYKWSRYIQTKDKICTVIRPIITMLKGRQLPVKYLRCDNAGENEKALEDMCREEGIDPEFTAPYTPQMNGVVEKGFETVRNSAVAMMLDARLTDDSQGKYWPEAVNTATTLNNITVTNNQSMSPYEGLHGIKSRIFDNLKEWGRVVYMTKRDKPPKLETKSEKGVLMGYPENRPSDTYRIYKESTNRIVMSRDVTFAEWHGLDDPTENMKMIETETEKKTQNEEKDEKTEKQKNKVKFTHNKTKVFDVERPASDVNGGVTQVGVEVDSGDLTSPKSILKGIQITINNDNTGSKQGLL